MLQPMFIRQLEYIVALDREGHFGEAADACGVTQPTLSAGLRRLEEEFGMAIVRRGSRFEGFTLEGEKVLQWAQRILADRDGLLADVGIMREGMTGRLRLGCIPTALSTIALATAPFTRNHPNVSVSVTSLSSREMVRLLAEFQLDAGVTYIDGEPLEDVRVFPLYRERYVLLTASTSFAGRPSVGWREVDGMPLCLLSEEMQNRRILNAVFADVGVEPAPAIETDSVSTLYAHVQEGSWSSVVPHAWLRMFPVPPGMRAIPLCDPVVTKGIGIVLLDRDPEPILGRAFVDLAMTTDLERLFLEEDAVQGADPMGAA